MNEVQEEFKGRTDVERYIAKLRADRLDIKTQKKHRYHLTTTIKYLNKNLKEITMEDIEKWKFEAVVNRKYAPETTTHNFLILRKFLRFLERNDLADRMTIPKHPKHRDPEKEIWLFQEEQEALIKKSREMGLRTEAMIRLFLCSGIRAGELQALEISDLNFEEQTIRIRHGKGDKSRTVFFDTETRRALLEYIEARNKIAPGNDVLFVSAYGEKLSHVTICETVKECAILAGIKKKITPHKLRHTFITTIIERTKDIPLAQKLAGHTEISTTMRYHHNTYEEIKAKYMEYFNVPKAKDLIPNTMSDEEILRTLDGKYLRGELPAEIYLQLRREYEQHRTAHQEKEKVSNDPAYR